MIKYNIIIKIIKNQEKKYIYIHIEKIMHLREVKM